VRNKRAGKTIRIGPAVCKDHDTVQGTEARDTGKGQTDKDSCEKEIRESYVGRPAFPEKLEKRFPELP
jgi:hypothetical protein